jgi:hypothetical protein
MSGIARPFSVLARSGESWRGVQVDAGLPEGGAMSDMIRLP